MDVRFKSGAQNCICLEKGIATPISHFEGCSLNYEAVLEQLNENAKSNYRLDSFFFDNISNIWGANSLTTLAQHNTNLSLPRTVYGPRFNARFAHINAAKGISHLMSRLQNINFVFPDSLKFHIFTWHKVSAATATFLLVVGLPFFLLNPT